MNFLGRVLKEPSCKTYQKASAAKNLAFFLHRQAVELLISVLKPDVSPVTKAALISLSQTASLEDIERITQITEEISFAPSRSDLQGAIEKEGFGDSSQVFLAYFISGCIERIKSRLANKVLVIGWLKGRVNMEHYEKAYSSMQKELTKKGGYEASQEKERREYWKNPDIRTRYISNTIASKILKEEGVVSELSAKEEHPDVQVLLAALEAKGVPFHRSQAGVLMKEADLRLVHWAKDGSLLIPALEGFIPFSLSSESFPVGGETAAIPGRNPLLLVSESVVTAQRSLQEMFPDVHLESIPHGFVTVRLPGGEEILRGTSHVDCVINVVPPQATKEGIPIVVVDPRYYKELTLREETTYLLEDIEGKYEAKIVVIPEEEGYLNPANFMLIDASRILLNHAPKTREKLLQAGMKLQSLIMLEREIVSLAPLGGMAGCLGGIYREDRIPEGNKTE